MTVTLLKRRPLPLYKKPPKSDLVFLRRLRRLIDGGWIRGEFAVKYAPDDRYCNVDGLRPVEETDPHACNVCLAGAANRVQASPAESTGSGAARAANLLGFKSVSSSYYGDVDRPRVDAMIEWNDKKTRRHAQVLARIDKAIQKLTP